MNASPVRVTGIEVVGDGPDIVVTLRCAHGRSLPYAFDEEKVAALVDILQGVSLARQELEAFGIGEDA